MRLVVTGGGTGGHIYPALAIAKEMMALLPQAKVLYIGTKAGMESTIVPREGLDFETVRSSGVMGKSAPVALKGLANAAMGISDAISVLRRFRPDVVVGTGGYASGPVMMAARILRIPRAIQEQNAVPGKTNLWLSRFSARTFAAWDYSVKFFPYPSRVVVTGNPVRGVIREAHREEDRRFFGLPAAGPVALLLGGSRGAKTLALAGIEIARRLPAESAMLFITGSEYYQMTKKALGAQAEVGIDGARTGNIILRPYVHDMAKAYGACNLVIGRAGGMTLSEITAIGLPAVIVPSPNVAGNHQEYNARALEEAGAALIVRESGEAAKGVAEAALGLLLDTKRQEVMAAAARRIGKPSAAREICKMLVEIARKGE